MIALVVAANIVRTGWGLLRRSAGGLMDASLPKAEREAIRAVLEGFAAEGLGYHALRTRQAGARAFVTLHLLVPDDWTVKRAHDWAERVERAIREAVPRAHVLTHLEPRGDDASDRDRDLDRRED